MSRPLALALLLSSACFHVRINEKTGDTRVQKTTFSTPFTDTQLDGACADLGTGLQTVRYSSNLGYAWLSVVTFGIVNLVDVEYACAPQTGVEPAPRPSPD
ncbi:MAG: hypothetical protein IPJ65_33665 [Archangiaceae bacterium]|nr:hypothetical protein [Archangiaceae bacterium]